jgi:hypothetical protein
MSAQVCYLALSSQVAGALVMRREFVTLAGADVVCKIKVSAQQPTRVAHIGFLGHGHGMGKHKSTRCLPVCATLAARKARTSPKGWPQRSSQFLDKC